MKITEVSVGVQNAEQTGSFYGDTLGLPVETTPGRAIVEIGATRLELVEGVATNGALHLAITIPSNRLAEAKVWVRQRTELLATPDADEFECAPAWNARSIYFAGPDDSVLEFIIRRELRNETDGAFTSADLLAISEVGVAVPDVPAVVAALNDDAGVPPYGAGFAGEFAPVGDAKGLLILVAPGRAWFPTADHVARESTISITAVGAVAGKYSLGARGTLRINHA